MTQAELKSGVSNIVLRAQAAWRVAGRTARLACGIGDYEAYVSHRTATHPGDAVLTYEAFFRARQEARWGNGRFGCC